MVAVTIEKKDVTCHDPYAPLEPLMTGKSGSSLASFEEEIDDSEMEGADTVGYDEIVAIRMRSGSIEDFWTPTGVVSNGDYVVVEVERGFDIAVAIGEPRHLPVGKTQIQSPQHYLRVLRVATEMESTYVTTTLSHMEDKARVCAQQLFTRHDIKATVAAGTLQYDMRKLTVSYFSTLEYVPIRRAIHEFYKFFGTRVVFIKVKSPEIITTKQS